MGLLSIEETAQLKSPRVTIHGTAGIGKTTLAAKMINPIFLCLEDGLGTLSVKHFTFKDDENKHAIDALRYGAIELITRRLYAPSKLKMY